MDNFLQIRRHGIFSLAGWLFADLFLALTVIFIAASTVGKPVPIQAPTPPPTMIPPTPTQVPQALDPKPLTFTVNVDPALLGNASVNSYVKNQVAKHFNQSNDINRQVGFVITLAGGLAGVDHAKQFNAILMTISAFQGAVFKNYHDLGNPDSEFDLEIYFFI